MSAVHTAHVKHELPDYLNGQLEQENQVLVEAHLRTCPECRLEGDALKNSLGVLATYEISGPPNYYFNNLLPKVRRRLEKGTVSWVHNSVWTRLVLPMVAAGIALVLVMSLPHSSLAPAHDILDGLSATIEPNELPDVVSQQHDLLPLSLNVTQELAEALASNEAITQQIVEKLRAGTSEKEYDFLSGIATDQLVGTLSESEVDALLLKLGERIVL